MAGVLTPIPKLAIPTATASIQYGVAPLMPISAAVAALSLWKGFFEASSLSALDNFFELGGDSLRAVRLMAAVRKELGVRLIARFGTLLRTDSAVIGAPYTGIARCRVATPAPDRRIGGAARRDGQALVTW
ncbi:acyl carrier protein [Streptomyces sp. SID685]|uniref:acyl carrier protein n=1 Tax=Streptomyces sp. SID685 TaxID=2690322 RepID=UPI0019292D49|nr:acyl carrier protein [Streptomyces sp. SID685]